MNKKILLFSRDPGGANTVAPLYNELIENGYYVKLYGKDAALDKYNQYNLQGIDINNSLNNVSQNEVYKFLLEESPDFLITGTSADDFTEKYLWKAAERLNIKSFAILDQWLNYGLRFSNFSVKELHKYDKDKKHPYVPYRILVMDEYAKRQMILEGINEHKIYVSGHPYFDYLITRQENIDKCEIINLKKSLCKPKDSLIITYVSEPISQIYNENDNSRYYWGYDEKTIFKEFFSILSKIAENCKKYISLIIRLHPKENENNYDDIVNNIDSKYISILIDKKIDGFNLMCTSNLICGMTSMFLIEAAVIGKPIISMQMGLKKQNSFMLHKKGIVQSILKTKELEEKLKKILVENQINGTFFKIKKGAIANVIEYMEVILCQC